jgi:hypothetical protein
MYFVARMEPENAAAEACDPALVRKRRENLVESRTNGRPRALRFGRFIAQADDRAAR